MAAPGPSTWPSEGMEEGEEQPIALPVRRLGGHSPWRNHKTSFSADSEGGDTLGAGTARGPRSQPVNTLALFKRLSPHPDQRVLAHHGDPAGRMWLQPQAVDQFLLADNLHKHHIRQLAKVLRCPVPFI